MCGQGSASFYLCPSQMRRALFLGASALLLLILNHNVVREVNGFRRGGMQAREEGTNTG